MTTTTAVQPTATPAPTTRSAPPGSLVAIAALSFAVATFGTIWGAHDRSEIAICMGLLILATALVYGVLLPRKLHRPSAHAAMAVATTGAVLAAPAFWSGLPMVLGAAGVILGTYALRGGKNRRTSIAAIVVGSSATLGYLIVYLTDISALSLGLG